MTERTKRKELSEVEREQITRWRDEGESYTEIARRLLRPVNTVRDCALRIKKRNSVENAPRSGRPRKETTKRVPKSVRKTCKKCANKDKAITPTNREILSSATVAATARIESIEGIATMTEHGRNAIDLRARGTFNLPASMGPIADHDATLVNFGNNFGHMAQEIPTTSSEAPDPVFIEANMTSPD